MSQEIKNNKPKSKVWPWITLICGILFSFVMLVQIFGGDTTQYASEAEALGGQFANVMMLVLGVLVAYWGYKGIKG